MSLKFLVTGGSGFIGSMICQKLIQLGFEVTALDDLSTGHLNNLSEIMENINFTFIKGDVRDYKTCLQCMEDKDYVIHQAALVSVPRSIEEPILNNQINIDGFINVLEAARFSRVKRVVFASSSAIYGDNEDEMKTEERYGNVISPYALSKYVDELYASLYSRIYGLETVGLRYFNVYGPKQDPSSNYSGVISVFFDSLLKEQDFIIYGDGSSTRDFVYVEDVAYANILASLKTNLEPGSIYNIGTSTETTINDLASKILSIAPCKSKVYYLKERKGDIKCSCANIDKAKADLFYIPKVSLEVGLKQIYSYLKAKAK